MTHAKRVAQFSKEAGRPDRASPEVAFTPQVDLTISTPGPDDSVPGSGFLVKGTVIPANATLTAWLVDPDGNRFDGTLTQQDLVSGAYTFSFGSSANPIPANIYLLTVQAQSQSFTVSRSFTIYVT